MNRRILDDLVVPDAGGLLRRSPRSRHLLPQLSGNYLGAVVANQGNIQYARGDAMSGFYFGAGGQYLTGYNVENNSRIDGNGGAYWRVKAYPEYGNLSVGVNFFGMHYGNNQDAFTFDMGGYFSPQAYFLANVPITWSATTRRVGITRSSADLVCRHSNRI
jgi:hypothetical protein